jgi:hypothetical protein
MQYFKGDAKELQMYAAGAAALDQVALQLDLFIDGAFETYPLGDLLFDNDLAPLSNAIPREIFREAFVEIFDAFIGVGSFEAYLTVFRKIFGDDVVVEFTVPAPGKLNIDIEATGIELHDFITRYIENNEYVLDEIVDEVDDNIVFQTLKGFQTQYELEQMLFEMVPAGIFTQITLDI